MSDTQKWCWLRRLDCLSFSDQQQVRGPWMSLNMLWKLPTISFQISVWRPREGKWLAMSELVPGSSSLWPAAFHSFSHSVCERLCKPHNVTDYRKKMRVGVENREMLGFLFPLVTSNLNFQISNAWNRREQRRIWAEVPGTGATGREEVRQKREEGRWKDWRNFQCRIRQAECSVPSQAKPGPLLAFISFQGFSVNQLGRG